MTISATDFKARCLELLDAVNQTGEVLTITKRGKVVAEVRPPYTMKGQGSGPGMAKGKIQITGDIVAPLDAGWDALK